MKTRLIEAFKADLCKIGRIWLKDDMCNVCNHEKVVIAIDSSENEYSPGCICRECAIRIFNDQ